MSARVFNPLLVGELRCGRAPQPIPVQAHATNRSVQTPVKRNLFGPVDHNETRRFLELELGRVEESNRDRWEFDFHNEMPYPTRGRYQWELTVEKPFNRPNKRKRGDEYGSDNGHLYHEVDEGDEVFTQVCPRGQTVSVLPKRQAKITEFLKVKKEGVSRQKKVKRDLSVVGTPSPFRSTPINI